MDSGVCVERENVFFKNNTIEKVFVVSATLVHHFFISSFTHGIQTRGVTVIYDWTWEGGRGNRLLIEMLLYLPSFTS